MLTGYQISRPSWMPRHDYDTFIAKWSRGHSVPIQCCHSDFNDDCEGYKNLTIDHITARHNGGTNDIANLQPLCARCNRRKYTHDDVYWKQLLPLDQTPNLDSLRSAHIQGVWIPITETYQGYFSRPINQINQMSYLYAWIVGAGKTLAIPITAMALNHNIRKNVGSAAPRIDRVLVLAKSTDLRDQVAQEIEHELIKYGIIGAPLRVLCVDDGDIWSNRQYIKQYDVVVACIHQLWKRDSGLSANKLQEVLSLFPLITIDERHWADDQCDYIVENAVNSLVFTTTGTPIDANGSLLSRLVLVSSWGYQDSNLADNSVKYLSNEPTEFDRFVKIVGIENADVMIRGEEHKVDDELVVDGYDKNHKPAVSVAEEVIMEMVERDNTLFGDLAPHRMHIRDIAVVDMVYPAHAVITVDNIKAADVMAQTINGFLDADRRKYPVKAGWRAVAFHSLTEDTKGDDTALDAWRRCYKNGNKLDEKCARIIVAVDKIREGINNPYCCIAGVAKTVGSMIEIVQGPVGRLIRAVVSKSDGCLHVPPEALDRVRIITHRAYRNRESLVAGINFIMDMNTYYSGLTSIDALIGGGEYTPKPGDKNPTDNLTDFDKVKIVVETGRYADYIAGRDFDGDLWSLNIDPSPIIYSALGGNLSSNKVERATDFTYELISNPTDTYNKLFQPRTDSVAVVIEEYLNTGAVTDEQLESFVVREGLSEYADKISDPMIRHLILKLYQSERSKFKVRMPAKTETLSGIRKSIATEIMYKSGLQYEGDKHKPFKFVGRAMKEMLGLPQDAKMEDDSDYDIPQVHYVLMNHNVRKCIKQMAITDLIRDGQIPHLSYIMREQVK